MAAAQHAHRDRAGAQALKPSLSPRPAFPQAAFYGGLGLFVLLSLLFQVTDWDLRATAHFYGRGGPWAGQAWGWAAWLYTHGEKPAFVTGCLGALGFGLSFASPRFRAWRGPGLFLFLLLALGPGLLVNGLAKALAGRPRPFETLGFGGLWEFCRPFHLGPPGRGHSFLSGHAASAWYFLGLVFLLKAPWRGLALLAALAFGSAMSLARVAQGAHWVSDTLLAGAAVFTLAAGLAPLARWQPPARFWRRPGLGWALGLGALAMLSISHVRHEDRRFILLWQKGPGRPMHMAPQQRLLTWQQPQPPEDVALELVLPAYDLEIGFQAPADALTMPLRLDAVFQGQGLPGARERLDAAILQPGDPGLPVGPRTLAYRFEQRLQGLWLTAQGRARLDLPLAWPLDLRLRAPGRAVTMDPLPSGRRVLITRLPEGATPPPGFEPYAGRAWLREGEPPLISLDLRARSVRFLDAPPSRRP